MSAPSLTSSIATPKVNAGHANSAASERFQDPSYNICPVFSGQDGLGRQVDPYTVVTTTAGCHSPDPRIAIENAHRPNYHSHLSTDGIHTGGTYSVDRSNERTTGRAGGHSFGGYDTMGVRRDEAYGHNTVLNQPTIGREMMGSDMEGLLEQKRLAEAMRRRHQSTRFRKVRG